MPRFVDKISGTIEETLAKLNKKKFIADPIAGDHFSKIVSLFSSAYKRHGFILEKAILEGVKESKDLEAWEEKVFHVTRATDKIIDDIDDEDRLQFSEEIDIEYSDKSVRQLQVDLITYNKKTKVMNAYEIKRGNGTHDAGKKRSMLRDLLSVRFLLKSYGKKKGYDVKKVGAYIVFYYGKCSLKKPVSLTKAELDEHFSLPLVKKVEEVNEYFRKRLYSLLSDT